MGSREAQERISAPYSFGNAHVLGVCQRPDREQLLFPIPHSLFSIPSLQSTHLDRIDIDRPAHPARSFQGA